MRHFMVILGGSGAGQAINLLGYPFLARLYLPEEFGIFGMFVAAAAVAGMVACGRFEFAIPTAPRRGVPSLLWLCCIVSAAIGFVSGWAAAIFLWARAAEDVVAHAALLGLSVSLIGICAASTMMVMRHDGYRTVAASVLARTAAVVLVQIGLAFVAPNALSLIIGFVAGLAVQAIILISWARRKAALGAPRRRHMRTMFAQYRGQVAVDFPSTLVGAFAVNILTFALGGLYDQRTVGFYAMGSRLAIVPLALFNDALSQVFFQKASRAKEEKGHMWDELKLSALTSGILSVAVLTALVIFAKPFIAVFLGPTWLPAADMLVVLAPMIAVRGLTMSIATTVFVLRSAHWLFLHNIATVLLPLAACGAAIIFRLGPIGFLALASALLFVEYSVFGAFLGFAANRDRAG